LAARRWKSRANKIEGTAGMRLLSLSTPGAGSSSPQFISTQSSRKHSRRRGSGVSMKVLRPWRTCSAFMGAYEKFDMYPVTRSGIIGSASGTQLKNCRPADLPINGISSRRTLTVKGWSVGRFRSRFLGSNFIRIRMKNQILVGLFLLGSLGTALCGMVPRVPGDRDLVQASARQSYYRVSVDSKKWWDWGLGGAPVEEPSMQNRGYGWDAIAIPFDTRGRVAFAPVYIYTITPDANEEARLQRLYQGLTTK
jgi:hypothetical protein